MKPNSNNNYLMEAVEYVRSGGVLIYPTETLYGLGVDALNTTAIQKLFELKKRNLTKPVPILMPNQKSVYEFCENISDTAKIFMNHFWPGPLTIILKSNKFPDGVQSDGKVGFRISSHSFAQAFLSYYKTPITSTSANISNKPSPSDPTEFFKIFPQDSFMLIQDTQKTKSSGPSTVIDCTEDRYKIVREGQISQQNLEKVLKENL